MKLSRKCWVKALPVEYYGEGVKRRFYRGWIKYERREVLGVKRRKKRIRLIT